MEKQAVTLALVTFGKRPPRFSFNQRPWSCEWLRLPPTRCRGSSLPSLPPSPTASGLFAHTAMKEVKSGRWSRSSECGCCRQSGCSRLLPLQQSRKKRAAFDSVNNFGCVGWRIEAVTFHLCRHRAQRRSSQLPYRLLQLPTSCLRMEVLKQKKQTSFSVSFIQIFESKFSSGLRKSTEESEAG